MNIAQLVLERFVIVNVEMVEPPKPGWHGGKITPVPHSSKRSVQSHDILYKVSRDILYTPRA